MKMFKKITISLVAGIMVLSLCEAALAMVLNGAGATFPYPIYSKWISEYNKQTGVMINYQPIGSGGGIRQFTEKVTDFGGTDAFMTEQEMGKVDGSVLHIPTVMGAVAVSYNLSGVTDLKLDAPTLVSIYMGEIKKWNDSRIAALNPGVSLPGKDILVAYRSDGSGTTSIFTSYLAKVSLKWVSKVGGKGNAGVAGVIKTNPGAIGYIELSYAISNNLSYASLKNKAGKFVKPSLESTSYAAAGALVSMPSDFRVDLTNASGERSYPIVGLTWLVLNQDQKSPEKGKALVNFLKWTVTTGQQYAPGLLYAPLPDELKTKVLAAIDTIRY
jgi:phosphate transport system substrate-binding protein